MSISLSTPRSLAGLSATAVSDAPSTNYREPIGAPAKQIALTAATLGREIGVTFGASGNSIVGTVDGAWTITGSPTGVTPCVLEGGADADITGTALPPLGELDGFEIRVHAGALSVSTSNSKIDALTFTAPAVLHLAGTGLALLDTITITATVADTTATITALYH